MHNLVGQESPTQILATIVFAGVRPQSFICCLNPIPQEDLAVTPISYVSVDTC